MAATIAIQAVLTWLQRYYLLRLETKLALGTSSRFFNHILRLPAAYFGQRFAGEIGSRVQINDDVAKIIGGRLATTTIDSVLTIFYATLMFLYDAKLTLAVLLLSAFNIAAVKAASRARTDASRRLKQDNGKLQGTAMNGLQMIETLKATGSEGEFFGRWAGYYAKSINTTQQLGVLGQIGARGAAVRADRDDRRGAGPRRPQGHEGRLHRRHAGRLPDAARQLHAAARQLRELQLVAAGAPGRHEPPGRRAALPGRRAVPRPGGADDRQGGRRRPRPARTASQPERRRSSVRPGPG